VIAAERIFVDSIHERSNVRWRSRKTRQPWSCLGDLSGVIAWPGSHCPDGRHNRAQSKTHFHVDLDAIEQRRGTCEGYEALKTCPDLEAFAGSVVGRFPCGVRMQPRNAPSDSSTGRSDTVGTYRRSACRRIRPSLPAVLARFVLRHRGERQVWPR